MKKYLFVCAHNFTRSKFGAEFFRGYLLGLKKDYFVFSRGINWISFFLGKRLKKRDLNNLEKVFVMEEWMKVFIIQKFNYDKNKIIVLNIKDEYGFMKNKSLSELDEKFDKINWRQYLK